MSKEQSYRPTAEFRERLELEVMRSYRYGNRARRDRSPRGSWVRAAVIALVSIALGTTAGLASAQIGRSQEKDSLLASARAEANLAVLRRNLARAEADLVNQKVRAGIEGDQVAVRANADLRAMDLLVARIGLNIEEINASGHAPRDDLNAPIVGGRDYVKQRIELEAATAQQRLSAAEGDQALIDRRVRLGASSDIERLAGLADIAQARAALAVLADKLALRAEFVSKGTPIDQLTRRLDFTQMQQDYTVVQAALNLAKARAEIVGKQKALGIVDTTSLLRAQLDVTTRSIELFKLSMRLRDAGKTPE